MIKMVACGELQDFPSRPHTSDSSQVRFVWAPQWSQIPSHLPHEQGGWGHDHHAPSQYQQQQQERQRVEDEGYQYGGLEGDLGDAPFKLPSNDTIIRTAHQLSRLASRNTSRQDVTAMATSLEGTKGLNGKGKSDDVNRMLGQKLKEYATGEGKVRRQRSASLNSPHKGGVAGGGGATNKRGRSRSVSSGGVKDRLPPLRAPGPVNVSVTKETIQGGGSRGSARLRYTSHWKAEA